MELITTLRTLTIAGIPWGNVKVYKNEYSSGGIALDLWHLATDGDDSYDESLARATVRVDGLEPDELAIKDYGENEGMLNALVEAGIIHPPHRQLRLRTSHVQSVPICKLRLTEPAVPAQPKERTMQQKALNEFIREQLGDDCDLTVNDCLTDDDVEELFDTGSVEIALDDDITIRIVTHCEVVVNQPVDTPDY